MMAHANQTDDTRMVIGACKIMLQIPESGSLKQKRQVLKSIIARMHNEFNIAIAEVGHQDSWQLATLAVVCVATEASYVQGLLERVVRAIDSGQFDLVLLDYETEII
jgi:uncharacterized protein